MREVILCFSLITGMARSTLAHEGNVDGFGYRYFHISNMNTGVINPGYNANVFYIGYSSFYK